MRFTLRPSPAAALLAALGATVHSQPAQLDSAAATRLDQLHQAPEIAGTRIYRGAVYLPGKGGAPAVFGYERRVTSTPDGLAASHITYDTRGEVIIEEAAQVSPAYTLQRFDMANRQTGSSGSAVVSSDGRRLTYSVRQGDVVRTGIEDVTEPVVTGPSLHGYVLQQWDLLAAGTSVQVLMLVLGKMRTYSFEIRQASQTGRHSTFSITPSSWLVRLAVAPLKVTFDTATRHVVRYEGRVPPMLAVDGKLQDFDARVEYADHAVSYR